MSSLKFNPEGWTGGNDEVTFTPTVTLNFNNATGVWYVEFRIKLTSLPTTSGTYYFLGASNATASGFYLRLNSGVYTLAFASGGTLQFQSSPDLILADGDFHTYRIGRNGPVGTAVTFTRDGSPFGTSPTLANGTSATTLGRIGRASSSATNYVSFELEYLIYSDSTGSEYVEWQASLSGGTGNTLPTVGNTNNGTLVNFTTVDADKWIDFGGGSDLATGSGYASVKATASGAGTWFDGDSFSGGGYAQVSVNSYGVGLALDIDVVSRSGYAPVLANAFGTGTFVDTGDNATGSGVVIVRAVPYGVGTWFESGSTSDLAVGSGYANVVVNSFSSGYSVELDAILGNGNNVVKVNAFGAGFSTETFPPLPDLGYGSGYASVVVATFGTGTVVDGSSSWGTPSVMFTEAEPIIAMALTFDQLGRPIVFYQTAGNDLKLYWFDPVAGQNVTQLIGTGQYPAATFDYLTNINYQESDAWIFYVKGNSVYSRLQRERWATEHLVRTYPTEPIIRSAGLTVGGRLQVVVDTVGACAIGSQGIAPRDTLQVSLGIAASIIETFTPEPEVPVDPPVIEDPEPPIIVDPPEVIEPTTPQGYWIKYPTGYAWTSGMMLVSQAAGFKMSIKIKKEVNVGNNAFSQIFDQTKRINTSATNNYITGSFNVFMKDGKFYVTLGIRMQVTKQFWSGDICPLCKIELEIKTNRQGVFRFWKENAAGTGYETVDEYQFPDPFPFEPTLIEEPGQSFSIGGTSYFTSKRSGNSDTIFRDFVFEQESGGGWINRLEDPLNKWNNVNQVLFYMPEHQPTLWQQVTGA